MSASSETGQVRQPLPTAEEIAKLPKDGGPEFNRLVFEHSPYLLQHARNPVDWRPWNEESFAAAKAEDKPILLSIGYTTCHWCHVMEHESFEDAEVGKVVNADFIAIKVDREERPDVDEVYMTVVQGMTGGGGWPMTVVMTPDKKPFFAGTYLRKEQLMHLLSQVTKHWKTDRTPLITDAEQITTALNASTESNIGDIPPLTAVAKAAESLAAQYDPEYAGFGGAPKFPVPPNLTLMLRHYHRTGDEKTLRMVDQTLRAMHMGGIYDQVGFGLHRYATDRKWLLPHFEKMLYDQALLAIACVEAYQITQDPYHAQLAREIFTYVLRDMTAPEGGFYSAEDADSEGEEGKFYVWTPAEVAQVLGAEEGALFGKVFNIVEGGNFIEEATRKNTGTSIAHLQKSIPDWAKELNLPEDQLRAKLEASREKLFAHREKRIHPQKDDKILTDWNGLMIAAFAKGAQVFDSEEYRQAAVKAADYVLTTLRDDKGRLLKRSRNGQAGLTAHLEDYAFVVWGLLDLYEATFNERYLKEAAKLTDDMIEHFWDDKDGGFFMTADDSEQLLVRSKKLYGGAIPSGNAVSALNLVRLHRITAKKEYEDRLIDVFKAFGSTVSQSPHAFPQFLIALDFYHGPSNEVVISGDPAAADTKAMLSALRKPFLPNKVVVFRPAADASAIAALAPYTETQIARDGKATAYVCRNFACNLPTIEVAKMMEQLQAKGN